LPEAFAAAEQLREICGVEFGRIEIVVGDGAVRRVIPRYVLRESDSTDPSN
jgi:hypothetical protein